MYLSKKFSDTISMTLFDKVETFNYRNNPSNKHSHSFSLLDAKANDKLKMPCTRIKNKNNSVATQASQAFNYIVLTLYD